MNESSPIRTDTARAYQPGEAPARVLVAAHIGKARLIDNAPVI